MTALEIPIIDADIPLNKLPIPSYNILNSYLFDHLTHDFDDTVLIFVVVVAVMESLYHDPCPYHPDGVGEEITDSSSH